MSESAPRYFARRKPRRCPACGAEKVVPILWGMATWQHGQEAQAGRIVLGGCCVSDRDPTWQCTACDARIYREQLRALFRQDDQVT